MNGDFIEDMEKIQEEYQRRFIKYSNEYSQGNDKVKLKMQNYGNCVNKMQKVMSYINNL